MKQAVLVTGASTGIGYATAELLAQNGFTVFAGVRNDADAARLEQIPGIAALQLDVTDAEQIHDASHRVYQSGLPLRAVVNNAGIAVPGPLEFLPVDEFRRQFEVNLFGALAVTQAFLPMLRTSRGRLVFMSSISGQIASPFVGPYSSSKFALESMSDALRMELRGSGVSVSVIQPGNVDTPIWTKGGHARERMVEWLPPHGQATYRSRLERLRDMSREQKETGIAASVVARDVLHAITAAHPKHRYAVGGPPAWMRRIFTNLPERVRDRILVRRMGFE